MMMFQIAKAELRSLLDNQSGNVSVVAALAMLPLLTIGGVALDYERAARAKQDLQLALDAAILSQAGIADAPLDTGKMEDFFEANLAEGDFVSADPQFTVDADGVITGSVRAQLQASFLTVVGVDKLNVSATSKGQQARAARLATATFQITSAQGAFDKNIYFFTRDEDGKMKKNLVLQYNYSYSNGRGAKAMTPQVTSSVTINVDDYASWGIAMEVFEDLSYTGKHINPVMHYSDDADTANWTRTSGECLSDAGQTNSWEDGGDSNYLDFVFTLKCTEDTATKRKSRLTG